MKKLFKIGWVVLIVGLLALGIGYFNGGNKNINFNGGRPTVVTKDHARNLNHDRQFDRLNLSASTADVVIRQGKHYRVDYYGTNGKTPQVQLSGKTLTIKQRGSQNTVGFSVSGDYNGFNINSSQNQIVVTVPKGHQLKGSIRMSSGDLTVNKVDLKDMTVHNGDGDVTYGKVSVEGGKTSLTDGDFISHQLTVHGHYTVSNSDGDNTVVNTKADGYYSQTSDGDNELFGQKNDDGHTLEQNSTAANVLRLINTDGDNRVMK